MKNRLQAAASRARRGFFLAGAWLRAGLRLILVGALLGALLGGTRALLLPVRWQADGYLFVRPLLLREGYLLTTDALMAQGARRLIAPPRVARVGAAVGVPDLSQQALETFVLPGGILQLRVTLPQPRAAEQSTQALLRDLAAEIEGANRTRDEQDRLVVMVSKPPFARRVTATPLVQGAAGTLAGTLLGGGVTLLRGWRRQRRIATAREAEHQVGAPTLATIPALRRRSR